MSVIDTNPQNASYRTVVATIGMTGNPYGLDVTPDNTRVYVTATDTDTVAVIDAVTQTVVATIGIPSPRGVTIDRDGKLAYVTNVGSGTLSVIDVNPASPTYNTVVAIMTMSSGTSTVSVALIFSDNIYVGSDTGDAGVLDVFQRQVVAARGGSGGKGGAGGSAQGDGGNGGQGGTATASALSGGNAQGGAGGDGGLIGVGGNGGNGGDATTNGIAGDGGDATAVQPTAGLGGIGGAGAVTGTNGTVGTATPTPS